MDGIKIFTRHIGSGEYQLFVKNDSYDCDFLRIVSGYSVDQGGRNVNYLHKWLILAPFKPGQDEIYWGSFTKDELKHHKIWFKFDTCKSKPSQFIQALAARSPATAKLSVRVGGTTDFNISERADRLELKDHIESIRFNIRDQMNHLIIQYALEVNKADENDMWQAIVANSNIGQKWLAQIAQLDFTTEYNTGITVVEYRDKMGSVPALYYQWFIKDYNLPQPNGTPPNPPFSLPMPNE